MFPDFASGPRIILPPDPLPVVSGGPDEFHPRAVVYPRLGPGHHLIGDMPFAVAPYSSATVSFSRPAARPPAETPSVDADDLSILRALAKYPDLRLTLNQLVSQTRPRVGRSTVAKRLECMMVAGWVARPHGKKSGARITKAGLEFLATQPADALDKVNTSSTHRRTI
jgi:hypothetical protein